MNGNSFGNVKRQLYFALFLFIGCVIGISAVQAEADRPPSAPIQQY
ncbi:MAG: hypothetical protein QGI08_05420 [Paracoccaceae bacterium]|nr:hypothetical protein [Paracoccaceae bacterium]